jgi:TetR/AcrR family transcriptional regulator, lmrAB and yxaGH operons repressor
MSKVADSKGKTLAAAAKLFTQRGYHGTALRDIIEAGGTPRASLYFHFPNGKEEIGEAAVVLATKAVREFIAHAVETSGNMQTFLKQLARGMAINLERSGYRDGCPIATTALETAGQSDLLGRAARNAFQTWEQEIKRGLVRFGMEAVMPIVLRQPSSARSKARYCWHGPTAALSQCIARSKRCYCSREARLPNSAKPCVHSARTSRVGLAQAGSPETKGGVVWSRAKLIGTLARGGLGQLVSSSDNVRFIFPGDHLIKLMVRRFGPSRKACSAQTPNCLVACVLNDEIDARTGKDGFLTGMRHNVEGFLDEPKQAQVFAVAPKDRPAAHSAERPDFWALFDLAEELHLVGGLGSADAFSNGMNALHSEPVAEWLGSIALRRCRKSDGSGIRDRVCRPHVLA